jgi:hypothetical protein
MKPKIAKRILCATVMLIPNMTACRAQEHDQKLSGAIESGIEKQIDSNEIKIPPTQGPHANEGIEETSFSPEPTILDDEPVTDEQIPFDSNLLVESGALTILSEAILQQIKQLGLRAAQNETFGLIYPPLVLSASASAPSFVEDEIYRLWAVPKIQESIIFLGDKPVCDTLIEYFDNSKSIVEGRVRSDDAELKVALEILYKDPEKRSQKTDEYAAYAKWQDATRELEQQIDKEVDDDVKLEISGKIDSLAEQYRLTWLDAELKIRKAKEVVERVVAGKVSLSVQLDELRRLSSKENEQQSLDVFYADAVSGKFSSVRLEGSGLPKEVTFTFSGEKQPIRISSLAYDFKLVPINQRSLSSQILANRMWKHGAGRLISLGAGEVEENEAIPVFITQGVVVQNVRIGFAKESAQLLQRRVKELRSAGGLPLPNDDAGNAYLLPGQLVVSRPVVIAAIAKRMPKIPNPLTSLEWLSE